MTLCSDVARRLGRVGLYDDAKKLVKTFILGGTSDGE